MLLNVRRLSSDQSYNDASGAFLAVREAYQE